VETAAGQKATWLNGIIKLANALNMAQTIIS